MTTFYLKLIAIISMIIDHVGVFIFPDILIFRIIGRVSFPIIAWLIANGASHTHNKRGYLVRLFALACLSQPIYYFAMQNQNLPFSQLNVLFTLVIGLGAIFLIQKTDNFIIRSAIIFFAAATAYLLKSDYGVMGILSIIFYYFFLNTKYFMIVSQVVIYGFAFVLWLPFAQRENINNYLLVYIIELAALFSLFFITLYNGREGRKLKYLFYIFYPLQFVIFYILQEIF